MPDNPLALLEEMLETDRASAVRQWTAAEAQLRAIDARRAMARHLEELVANMRAIGFAPRIDLVDEGRVIRLEVDVFAAMADDQVEGEEVVVVEIVDLDAPDEASIAIELDVAAVAAAAAPTGPSVPLPADLSAPASPVSRFGNPWTAEEDEAVLKLRRQGVSCEAIGEKLNRSARAVSQRYVRLLDRPAPRPVPAPLIKQMPAGPPATAPAPASEIAAAKGVGPEGRAEVPAAEVPPAARGGTASVPAPADAEEEITAPASHALLHEDEDALPVGDRAAWRRIKALGRGGTWSLERDIALIEGLCLGRKLVPVADEIGVLPAAAKGRFQCLCPDPTMEEQARVLRLLRKLEAQQVAA